MLRNIIKQIFRYKSSTIAFCILALFVTVSFLSINIYRLRAFSSTPRTDTIGFDGEIYSTAIGPDGTIYVGGFFDEVVSVPEVGGGIAVDGSTATANLNSRGRTNGRVRSAVPDGSGGWYIAGSFSSVQDVSRNNIAHIFSNGTLDTNFDPSVDGEVFSIVLNGSTLYTVGNFATVNIRTTPVLRKRAAAFNTSNGVVTSWDPSLNAAPVGMIIASSTAYIYGSGFTRVNSTTTNDTRNGGIAAFDLTNGTVTSWNPSFGGVGSAKVISVAASSDTLYVGGTFTSVIDGSGTFTRKSLVAFKLLDGLVKTTFAGGVTDPQFAGQAPPIYSIAVSTTTVYVGGIFEVASSTVSTTTRVNLAAFDFNGVVTNWNPDVTASGVSNSSHIIYSVATNGSSVYAAGNYDHVNIGSSNAVRRGYAAFDVVNGTVTGWNPDPICGATKAGGGCLGFGYENVNTTPSVTDVYIGGGTQNMTYVGPYIDRNGLAAIDGTTGQVTSWNPNVIYDSTNPFGVYSIVIQGGTLYAGGWFKSVNGGTVRNGLAAFDLTTGVATSWDPNVAMSFSSFVKSIAINGTTLYAGGQFTTVNGGTTRNNLAAFNLTDGTATSWNPDIDTGTDPVNGDQHLVNSIALSSTALYAGGLFSTVNNGTTPVTRYNLAAFNLTDGTATSWNPSIHNTPIRDTDWATTTAAASFNLALKTNGTLWSFGCDCYGELGGNHERDSSDPTQVGTDTWLVAVGSVGDYSSIGIKTNGTMWSWGQNSFGELGLGDTLIHRTTAQVGSDSDWAKVTMGDYHTLAIKTNGTLWAWGSNYNGELGQNDLVQRYTPTQIGVATNWLKISAGSESSFAIKSDGTLWSWGANGSGQLGQGDTTELHVPTQVGVGTTWVDVSAGVNFTIGLKSDGTLWSWGSGTNGRTGQGDTSQRLSPTQVGTDTDWASISAGDTFAFAIKQNGKLYAWGRGNNYVLGLGDTSQRLSPTQVGTDTDWAKISGGYDTASAIKANGRLYAWGSNSSGGAGQNWSGPSFVQTPTEVVRKDQDVIVNKIALNSKNLYAAGQFTAVNYATTPVYRDDVAGFNLTDGTATSFNPNLGAKAYGGWNHWMVDALFATDDVLYVGRNITIPSPTYTYSSFSNGLYKLPGERGMAFNLFDGSLSSWTPGISRTVGTFGSVFSFFSDGNKLIIGGFFDQTNSTTSPNFLNNFAIFSNTSPNAPITLGPTNLVDGSSTSNTQPQFTFNLTDSDVGDLVKYRIVISKNSDYSSPVVDYTGSIGAQGAFSFTVGQATSFGTYTVGNSGQNLSNGSYYWEVRTIDQDGAVSAYTLANSGAIAFVETGSASCNVPQRINMGPADVLADGVSTGFRASISADGRYTAYSSLATNLVAGDINGAEDVFVYDRVTGLNELISVADGGTQGNGASLYPSISADGRYVAYQSTATNLVASDANGKTDIFVYDRQNHTVQLISRADGLSGALGDGDSSDPFISPDGMVVAFVTGSANLLSAPDTNGLNDIYIRNLVTNTSSIISVSTANDPANGISMTPAVSYDGRYVVFTSEATNLVSSPDTNGFKDSFVRDTQLGTTVRVSESTGGVQGNLNNLDPAISWDGQTVAFEADSDNLVPGDTNSDWDVFVKDMNTGTLEMVSLNDRGGHLSTFAYSYYENYLSFDGRYVSFESQNDDVVSGYGTTEGDIFIRDRVASSTRIASLTETCEQAWGWGSALSASGQYVEFMTWGTNILPTDTNGIDDNILIKLFDDLPVTISALGPTNKVDGSSSTETTPTLSFNFSFPAKYQIQIDDAPDFLTPVVDYTSEWGSWNTISFTVGQVPGNGTYTVGSASQTLTDGSYYWRVRATDNNALSTAYSVANGGSIAFVVGTPVVTPPPSQNSGTPSNGPIAGSYGQVGIGPYLPPFIASIQAGNQPPTPPVLGPIVPEPVTTPAPEITSTPSATAFLEATKIVCDSESDLPNWGLGGPDVTESTATTFLSAHPNCHRQSGWQFMWAQDGTSNPGDNYTSTPISGWKMFGPTNSNGSVSTEIPVGRTIWIREVPKSGYVLFTHDSYWDNSDTVSAEMYCDTDVLNYDNWEFISGITTQNTYHCISLNAQKKSSEPKTPTTPTPTDLSSLPPCPTVLGASITKTQNDKANNTDSKSNSTTIGNNGQAKTGVEGNGNANPNANAQNNKNKNSPSETVGITVALPFDSFDYSVNNGTTVKEINAIFVAAVKHARDFRKLTIASIDKKSPNHNDVVVYANGQFKIARDTARNARNAARKRLKDKTPISVPVPTPASTTPQTPVTTPTTTPVTHTTGSTTTAGSTQGSGTGSGSTSTSPTPATNNGSTQTGASSTGVTGSGTQTSTQTSSSSNSTSTGHVITVNTGDVSTTPDGKPCLVYKTVVLPPATIEDENNPDDLQNDNQTNQDEVQSENETSNNPELSEDVSLAGIESVSDYIDDMLTSYYLYTSPDAQDFVASIPDKIKSAGVQTTGAVAVGLPLLTSIFLSTKSFAGGVPFVGFGSYLFYFVPQALKLRKKAKPWGTVYDSVTKRPIPFARVEILNSESRKLESAVTDAEGRYGFLVAPQFTVGDQALVQLRVYQKNYSFPSVEIPTANEQVVYENIYQGGLVDVRDKTVNFDIPMDPKNINNILFGTTYFKIMSVSLNNLWSRISDGLFVLGIVFGIVNYTVHPNWLGILPIVLILLTSLLRVSGFKLKPFGLTKEAVTKNPLPFTFIALHALTGDRETFTVSDERGRYFLLTKKGKHYLRAYTAAHVNPMRQVTMPVNTRQGWISNEIEL